MTPNSPHYQHVKNLKAREGRCASEEDFKYLAEDAIGILEDIADAYEERIREINKNLWKSLTEKGTDGFRDLIKEALRPL